MFQELLETTDFQFGWDRSDEIDNDPFAPIGLGINHTGMIIGLNEFGQLLVIHNHPETNIAIARLETFLNGYRDYNLRAPSIPLQKIQYNIAKAIIENTMRFQITVSTFLHL
ncbi:hypothetical protein [Leptospira kirschneri]|uniref:hypothetical protein n=1 Tax=Leptospira kirschneri TaxID=29507 RepID=UPI0021000318|nr:hypothetical protein [Leptospira kirschneri]